MNNKNIIAYKFPKLFPFALDFLPNQHFIGYFHMCANMERAAV